VVPRNDGADDEDDDFTAQTNFGVPVALSSEATNARAPGLAVKVDVDREVDADVARGAAGASA
jgi:hypothetical protein